MLHKQTILNVDITTEKKEVILEYIFATIEKKTQKIHIVTPNPEIIVYASKHSDYLQILNQAQIALPDGVGLTMAGMVLGKPFPERITGVDFMHLLCQKSIEKTVSIGLLGGKAGIAELTADCLKRLYPGIEIVYVAEEWSLLENEFKHIDILFVAFGHPKQEEWISSNLERLPVTVAMGVGGAFDYISSSVKRAPESIRKIGLEWLFRLILQPWRWKRQVALLEFMLYVCRDLVNKE